VRGAEALLLVPPLCKNMCNSEGRRGRPARQAPDLDPKIKKILDRILEEEKEVFDALARL